MVEHSESDSTERPPTQDELRAMAYADGELTALERGEFEALLATRADLRREVSRLKRLDVLARAAAGPEPMDHEWRALASDPLQRALKLAGVLLLCGGALTLAVVGLCELWSSAASLWIKSAALAAGVGFGLLLGAALRARLRTRRHDSYTELQR